tara:strand:- start:27 stop:707 length:681 start_codon:yes stop_codon:yes gene_type:complete
MHPICPLCGAFKGIKRCCCVSHRVQMPIQAPYVNTLSRSGSNENLIRGQATASSDGSYAVMINSDAQEEIAKCGLDMLEKFISNNQVAISSVAINAIRDFFWSLQGANEWGIDFNKTKSMSSQWYAQQLYSPIASGIIMLVLLGYIFYKNGKTIYLTKKVNSYRELAPTASIFLAWLAASASISSWNAGPALGLNIMARSYINVETKELWSSAFTGIFEGIIPIVV